MSKKVKTVSTISNVRKALFVHSKEVLGNFKSACDSHLTAVGDIRAHFVALGNEGNFDFCDVIIGDTPQAVKKNETLGDSEVIAHTVGFAIGVREIHAQATFAGYSADQIKAKGGAEKALVKARNAAKTWYVEAIKGTKRNTGKATGTFKPQSKGKKNGKVTDLVEVADQQALNYARSILALIDLQDSKKNDSSSLRAIFKDVVEYHALEEFQ